MGDFLSLPGYILIVDAPSYLCAPRSSPPTPSPYLLPACDGIWDVMTSEEVADYVRSRTVVRTVAPALPLSKES